MSGAGLISSTPTELPPSPVVSFAGNGGLFEVPLKGRTCECDALEASQAIGAAKAMAKTGGDKTSAEAFDPTGFARSSVCPALTEIR
ncbi:hypothetical protein ACFJIW_12610 [Tahibacter sp. UC22_41]|uniref:hypothetical protein n=1 Tax=Tahibacter sp. UC22_41 TaxID=3350178 RepID=UPI0036DBDABA